MNENKTENMVQDHDSSSQGPNTAPEVAKGTEAPVQAASDGVVSGYKKIENAVVSGYKKIESGVVGGYKKIENGAVEGFSKVVDKCVEVLFAAEGESVEDARKRLSGKEEK